MSDLAPKRRWFRFRLGALLLFIAAVAVVLNVVSVGLRQKRDRQAMLGRHTAPNWFKYGDDADSPIAKPKPYLTIQPTAKAIGLRLRILGESEAADVNLFLPPSTELKDEIERASALFPEAVIRVYRMKGRRPVAVK